MMKSRKKQMHKMKKNKKKLVNKVLHLGRVKDKLHLHHTDNVLKLVKGKLVLK